MAAALADTYIVNTSPNNNFDGNLSFEFGTTVTSVEHALISLDMSGVTSAIASATLTVNVATPGSSAVTCEAVLLSDLAIVAAQATWNRYATGLAWTIAGGDIDDGVAPVEFTMPTGAGALNIAVGTLLEYARLRATSPAWLMLQIKTPTVAENRCVMGSLENGNGPSIEIVTAAAIDASGGVQRGVMRGLMRGGA